MKSIPKFSSIEFDEQKAQLFFGAKNVRFFPKMNQSSKGLDENLFVENFLQNIIKNFKIFALKLYNYMNYFKVFLLKRIMILSIRMSFSFICEKNIQIQKKIKSMYFSNLNLHFNKSCYSEKKFK